MVHNLLFGSLFSLAVGAVGSIIMTDEVPILGPSFPTNFDLSDSKAINDAKSKFPDLVEKLFSTNVLNSTDTVFAVDVFSAATNGSIYNYFHVGQGQNATLTSGELNDETIFRIGSVSKFYTVYALLAKAGMEIFSHPVIKYLPELAGNSQKDALEKIYWEDITVGALASHQAGSGGVGDILTEYEKKLDELTPDVFLNYMRDAKHPVISPFRTAVYSDGGFALLGLILERLTGKTYNDALKELIYNPLGLEGISASKPSGPNVNAVDRKAIDNTSNWGTDIDIVKSSGGVYANAAALRATGLSVLRSEILSPATTRAWMKPLSGTGSMVELVGAPWEITRLAIPVTPGSNRTRVSDLYIKSGGTGDYTTILALSPDHGIGYSVLVAGRTASGARWPIRQLVGETFIPAAEHAAAENAKLNFAGTYVDDSLEGTNLTIAVDEGRPGLGLESLYFNGTESRGLMLGITRPGNISARLYPSGVNSRPESLAFLYASKGSLRMSYRLVGRLYPLPERSEIEGGEGLFDNSLMWMNLGFFGSTDELILEIEDGKLMTVTFPGVKVAMKRVSAR